MTPIHKSIDVAVVNIKRLNNLKAKRSLTREETELFNLYKIILKANDTGVSSPLEEILTLLITINLTIVK